MAETRALVWFKRDLRVHDHAPLVAAPAQAHAAALALFVIEPAWLQSPECDAIHGDFALACRAELREALARRGLPLLVRFGPAMAAWRRSHNLPWQEFTQTGVVRRQRSRAGCAGTAISCKSSKTSRRLSPGRWTPACSAWRAA